MVKPTPYYRSILNFNVIIFVCFVAMTSLLNAETLEQAYNSPTLNWSGGVKTQALPLKISVEYGTGYIFDCDFTKVNLNYQRCYWDATNFTTDLSNMESFSMYVNATDVSMIDSVSVFFKSGSGWYIVRGTAIREGWGKYIFYKDRYYSEGKPVGWDKITGIRINVLKIKANEKQKTQIRFVGLTASESKIEHQP